MKKETKNVIIQMSIIIILTLVVISPTLSLHKSATRSSSELALSEWSVSLIDTDDNTALTVVSETVNATYSIRVRSLSEVDVGYNITVTNLPSGVEVALDSGEFQTPVNNTVTFTGGTILYSDNNKTKTHTLTFRAVSGATVVYNQAVTINVLTQQI